MALESFNAYHSYLKAIEPLNDAERGRLFTACLEYSMTGEAPELKGNEKFVFPSMAAQIDRDKQKYMARCRKNAENVAKRWNTNVYDGKNRIPEDTKHTKDKDKDKDKDNIAATAATARERCGLDAAPSQSPPEDPGLAQAAQCYEANIGPLPRYVGERLQFWLATFGPDLVCEAIHRAAAANARSWNYAEKILRDWQNTGVRTVDAARMERASRQRPAVPHSQGAPGNRRETADEVWRKIAEGGDGNDQAGGSGFAAIDGEILAELPPGR